MQTHRLLALSALCTSLGACTPFSLSPPARTLPLESSATLAPGQAAVAASGGLHSALGSAGGHAEIRGRVGLAEHVELQGEANYVYIGYPDERDPHVGAGRLGLKLAPVPHVAVVFGSGAGAGTHGAFFAPDAGLIFAYENPYVVPFFAARMGVSLPIDPNAVVVSHDPDPLTLIPPDTLMWQLSTGLRIPIAIDPERGLGVSLMIGVAYSSMHGLDGQHERQFIQGATGFEIQFGGPGETDEPAPTGYEIVVQ